MAIEQQVHPNFPTPDVSASDTKDSVRAVNNAPNIGALGMEIEKEDLSKVYIVEKILKFRWMNRRKYAKVKWQGYPYRESTWEPVESLFKRLDQPKQSVKPEKVSHVKELEKIDGKRWQQGRTEYRVRFKGMRGPRSIKWMTAAEIERPELITVYEKTVANAPENIQEIPDHERNSGTLLEEDTNKQIPVSNSRQEETCIEPPHSPTPLESAVKLELSPIPACDFKAIDQWSPEEIRDYLSSVGFAEEAVKLYEEAVDGVALGCITTATVICQCGILLGPALKLFRVIRRMQNGKF